MLVMEKSKGLMKLLAQHDEAGEGSAVDAAAPRPQAKQRGDGDGRDGDDYYPDLKRKRLLWLSESKMCRKQATNGCRCRS